MTTATEVALVLVFFIAAVVNGVTGPGIAILSLFFGGFTLWYVATELRREVADVPRRLPAPVAAAIGAVAGNSAALSDMEPPPRFT